MARHPYADDLAKISLFSSFGDKDLDQIAKIADRRVIAPGTAFIRQGDSSRDAFIVVEGTALVDRNGQQVASLGPGDVVGELALLDPGPRTATVTAATHVRALVLSQPDFQRVIATVPELALLIMQELAHRVRQFDQTVYG